MQFNLHQLEILPGQRLIVHDLDWDAFRQVFGELSERRGLRVHYHNGTLEIMSSLPQHDYDRNIISDLIQTLLEELGREFCNAGSATFFNRNSGSGLEPDLCFYIEHEPVIRGKSRIELDGGDPPPDLVLEIDVTIAETNYALYAAFGVPELWRFDGKDLSIELLQPDGHYAPSEESRQFPSFPLRQAIPHYLRQTKIDGRNATLRTFREWVRTVSPGQDVN
ncbi:Uma2 family endonuclease [Gammaproteobacteria bacterium]